MDKHNIQGGQNWEFEINKALDKASIIVAFVSKKSIDRRGYVQKELRAAIEHHKTKLIDDIFIVPIMLDDINIPAQLRDIHCLSEQNQNCFEELKASLSTQIARLGKTAVGATDQSGISWSLSKYKDSWEGLPGYDASCQTIRLHSSDHKQFEEINYIVNGYLARELIREREVTFHQIPSNLLNFGMSKYRRTNTYDAICSNISVVSNVISIEYVSHWYGAGAAHGFSGFKTFVFIVSPTVMLDPIEDIFLEPERALDTLQAAIRPQLATLVEGDPDHSIPGASDEWIRDGTATWRQLQAFAFVEDGMTFMFAPYQVAAYAWGPQRVTLNWRTIRPLLKHHILCALNREFEHFDEKSEEERAASRPSGG